MDDCLQFTHYQSDSYCYLYEVCNTLSADGCEGDCISGDAACPQLICSAYGTCNGPQIGSTLEVSNEDDCIAICKGNDECFWYSYDVADNLCSLMSACDAVDACNNDLLCTH